MNDVVARLGPALLNGPILALIGLVVLLLAGMAGYGLGRRAAFREVDEKRAAVRAAYQQQASRRIARFLPSQRDGGQ